MSSTAARFLAESTRNLRDVHLPRLARALKLLPEQDLWWRPNDGSLSFGNVLLHLAGNLREWIVGGVGGREFRRDRDAELNATDGPPGAELLERLTAAVDETVEVVAGLDEERLLATYAIRGEEQDGLSAIYHVVEHFAYHTGQAMWIAKARAGLQSRTR